MNQRSKRNGVAVLGVFMADVVFRVIRPPLPGETLHCLSSTIGPGGKGSNQAIGIARLGSRARLVGRIGSDSFGDLAQSTWRDNGVSFEGVVVDKALPTGVAGITVLEATGENSIVIDPGAGGCISVEDVRNATEQIVSSAVLVTQLEQPLAAAAEALRIARSAGVTTILNPAPVRPLGHELLALCDLVVPNQTEAGEIAGHLVTTIEDAIAAGRRIIALGARAAVVTLGAEGAVHVNSKGAVHVPALKGVVPVDTTGAGDAFCAGLAVGLSEGMEMVPALQLAAVTAGLAVTGLGAAQAMPHRAQCERVLAECNKCPQATILQV